MEGNARDGSRGIFLIRSDGKLLRRGKKPEAHERPGPPGYPMAQEPYDLGSVSRRRRVPDRARLRAHDGGDEAERSAGGMAEDDEAYRRRSSSRGARGTAGESEQRETVYRLSAFC